MRPARLSRPLHSRLPHDLRSQTPSESWVTLLAGIPCSRSRRGDCWDNAVVESFSGTRKAELVHRTEFATHEAAATAIAESIESFYNPRRRHSSLGCASPLVFELQHTTAALAA